MIHLISPHYTEAKLQPPFYRDLVDVFEDRMRYWMLYPAKKLLKKRSDQVAAVGILINYLEGIEIYLTGKDSRGNSYNFFVNAFQKIFFINEGEQSAYKECANVLYIQARCGFSHDGLFRNRVFFSESNKNAILICWPKKDGKFVYSQGVEHITINPVRFYQVIELHFENYLRILKKGEDRNLVKTFKDAVELKWGLEIEHINFGMTEREFCNNNK